MQLSNQLWFDGVPTDWGVLCEEGRQTLAAIDGLCAFPVMCAARSLRDAFAITAYALAHRLDWGVIDESRLSDAMRAHIAGAGLYLYEKGKVFSPSAATDEFTPAQVRVLTSGTTGMPKLIRHRTESLHTFQRLAQPQKQLWYAPYQVGSYAWFQMVFLSLSVPGQHLYPAEFAHIFDHFSAALQQGKMTAISSTPTFWRQALLSIDEVLLARAALRQITLGGERVDQPILDRLRRLYPDAVIRHIYASSEAGAAIVVSDGKAGFPAAYLARQDAVIKLKVVDDVLHVASPYSCAGDNDLWIDTRDRVKIEGDRVYFIGRADESMINVGGQKAFPAEIEAHLMTHPMVAWAKVVSKKAPLVGELPLAQVVLTKEADAAQAEVILIRHCSRVLAEYAIPRIWQFLDAIPIKGSLKG